MNKITFICQVFHPDTTSTSQLFAPLLEEITQEGIEVEVLCGFPAQHSDQKISRQEYWNGLTISRCGFQIPLKKNFLYRGLSYFSFLAHVLLKLLLSSEISPLFAVSNPPFTALILALVKILKKRPFSYMLLDLHPEGLIVLGNLESEQFLVKIWFYLNGWAYRQADRIAILGRDMPDLLKRYQLSEPLYYIPHWSIAERKKTLHFEESQLTQTLKLQNQFVVQYSGNMGLWHDMETFVRVAKELQEHTHITFLFIGGGIRKEPARKLAENFQLENIIWHDFVPTSELTDSLSCSHLSLISLNTGLEGVAVPCKLYGILASGRAILAQVPSNSEVALTVKEHECGSVFIPGDVTGVAKQILWASEHLEEVQQMGNNAFQAYQEHYTLKQAKVAFKDFLQLNV